MYVSLTKIQWNHRSKHGMVGLKDKHQQDCLLIFPKLSHLERETLGDSWTLLWQSTGQIFGLTGASAQRDTPMNVLYWLRSDLRLHDNPALSHFAEVADHGLIVWCPSRSQRRAGAFRRHFLWSSLAALAKQIEVLGGRVQIDTRDIRELLTELLILQSFDLIVFNEEPCSEEREDEAWVRSLGIPCASFAAHTLLDPKQWPFARHEIPEVFTHFRKKVEEYWQVPAPLPAPQTLPGPRISLGPADISHASLAAPTSSQLFTGGEKAGHHRLSDYLWRLDRLKTYKDTRDGLLDWNDSSKLSPWLAVGALSPRIIYREVQRYESERIRNESTYWLIFELLWRDYFYGIALKWGPRLFTGMKAQKNGQAESLTAWKQGLTPHPFINAHMLELQRTGWMSNRGRQNVANYLVKTLGGDWRLGAAYFEEQLIDYDPASNWGNWAYQAGVGQDPRDRRFDPDHQAALYDPQGLYVQRWQPKS